MRVLTVFGTRPEAIKFMPIVMELQRRGIPQSVCVTGQHRQMLDQILKVFDVKPDFDLNVMRQNQTLSSLTSDLVPLISNVISEVKPTWTLVQGDTTTAFAASLASYYAKVAIGHVEAGLRTGDLLSPWPEEGNRRLISSIANLHFAPTQWSADNLLREGILRASVVVTGNTVIDALLEAQRKLECSPQVTEDFEKRFGFLNSKKKLLLVTGHRRESFGEGFQQICEALATLAQREDVEIVYPVHLNPQVNDVVRKALTGTRPGSQNIHLIEPLEYLAFLYLMRRSYLILTDSGGVQEEAPTVGKPVLVMRAVTERPEAIEVGTSQLVGTSTASIVKSAAFLLDNTEEYERRKRIKNPYGDGLASGRIIDRLMIS